MKLSTTTKMAIVAGAALGAPLAVQGVEAHTANQAPQLLYINEDRFWNYDFLNQSSVQQNNVDWGVDIIYLNNANINKVKGYYWGTSSAGTMNGKVDDGSGLVWDTDKGTKDIDPPYCFQTAHHMRLYAPPSTDDLYNVSWGYYVIATTHEDRNERCPYGSHSGWSENNETWFLNYIQNRVPTVRHWSWFANPEPERDDGGDHWQGDGYASYAVIP